MDNLGKIGRSLMDNWGKIRQLINILFCGYQSEKMWAETYTRLGTGAPASNYHYSQPDRGLEARHFTSILCSAFTLAVFVARFYAIISLERTHKYVNYLNCEVLK
jgi:hypothetical protein